MKAESLNHFKSVTAHRFFVAPADENYLIARWLLINGFPSFFWHASQAIEKYMKAGLVLNDVSVARASHSLPKLYLLHKECMGEVSLKKFIKPDALADKFWRDEKVSVFIRRLDRHGHPDSRYGLVSWSRRNDDVFKLDQLCFHLRRTTIGLNWQPNVDFPSIDLDEPFATYADALKKRPKYSPRSQIEQLESPIYSTGGSRGDLLHSWNFDFVRRFDDLSKPTVGKVVENFGSMANSYMYLYWSQLLEKDSDGKFCELDPVFLAGMQWLIGNIKLDKKLVSEVKLRLEQEKPQ